LAESFGGWSIEHAPLSFRSDRKSGPTQRRRNRMNGWTMNFARYAFAILLIGIGVIGLIEIVIAFQNRDSLFVGGYITGINALSIMGGGLALMGFGAAYLVMRRR
jgi:hypothetical protein